MTLVLDRDLETDELAKFYRVPAEGTPGPADFLIEGRVVRYECESDDAAKWRLALEVYLAKALRDLPPAPRWNSGVRERAGLRKLHLG